MGNEPHIPTQLQWYRAAVKERDAFREHLANCMGHLDTPIARRRLGIAADTDWLSDARSALDKKK